MKSIRFITLSVSILLLASCSGFLDLDGKDFYLDETGEVFFSSVVSLEKFTRNVVGCGWKCVDFRDIKDDGSLATKNESLKDGWGPSDYYFDESTVTSYFDDMTRPARCYYTYNYIFDDSTIRTGSNNDIRLLNLSDGKFTCVSQIGWKYTGKNKNPIPHYMYFKYKKMTDKELQDYRDKYTTDFESLLNKGE